MLDHPVESLPVVSDARWSSAVTGNSLAAFAVWIVLLVLLQAIGAPIAGLLFDRFGELGWGLARLVTLLLAGYLVWIFASVRFINFEAVWCWAALVIVASGSWVLARNTAFLDRLKRRRRIAIGAEVTFWLVFAFFLLLRWANPDSWHPLWGGEKPMEFAHLNAILRSAHFPPYDPWFSGGFINYYYYGTYLIAFCIKLTGIPSETAFNLAQPTVIALLASSAYSVAATIGRGRSDRHGSRLAGWLGALLLLGIGNLSTLVRVAHAGVSHISPDFSWTWNPSRAIFGGITEFPYFTALYADLHAHVIAWPITILVIASCYSLASDPRLMVAAGTEGAFKWSARRLLGARLLFLAITLGTLFATNAWDVAAYGALFVVSICMATRLLNWFLLRIAMTVGLAGTTAAVAYGLFLPFFDHYVAPGRIGRASEIAHLDRGLHDAHRHLSGDCRARRSHTGRETRRSASSLPASRSGDRRGRDRRSALPGAVREVDRRLLRFRRRPGRRRRRRGRVRAAHPLRFAVGSNSTRARVESCAARRTAHWSRAGDPGPPHARPRDYLRVNRSPLLAERRPRGAAFHRRAHRRWIAGRGGG